MLGFLLHYKANNLNGVVGTIKRWLGTCRTGYLIDTQVRTEDTDTSRVGGVTERCARSLTSATRFTRALYFFVHF